MVREELHAVHLDVAAELVDLQPGLVVDVDILFLRDGVERLVVQPLDVPHRLVQVQFRVERGRGGVERCDVTSPAGDGEVPAVAGVVDGVRSELVEREGEALVGGGDMTRAEDVVLGDAPRPLKCVLGLEQSVVLGGEEQVVVFVGMAARRLCGGGEVFEVVFELDVGGPSESTGGLDAGALAYGLALGVGGASRMGVELVGRCV